MSKQTDLKRSWYAIKTAKEGSPIEVSIYDEIGYWGIKASAFIRDLKAADDGKSQIVVAINSPGGDVFDGYAIYNALSRIKDRCTVRIDALAASAASFIACAAGKVVIAKNAMMMIHNPWTLAYGSADEIRKQAAVMDAMRDSMIAMYQHKAPQLERAALIQMLDDETWMTADEAVQHGLADEIDNTASVLASIGSTGIIASFQHPPPALLSRVNDDESGSSAEEVPESDQDDTPVEDQEERSPSPPTPVADEKPEIDQVKSMAARITQACIRCGIPDVIEALIMQTTPNEATVSAEVKRIEDIRGACMAARMPELTAKYVSSGLPVEAVKARLFETISASNGDEIDNKEPPPSNAPAPASSSLPDSNAIYSARKKRASPKKSQPA